MMQSYSIEPGTVKKLQISAWKINYAQNIFDNKFWNPETTGSCKNNFLLKSIAKCDIIKYSKTKSESSTI